MISIVLRGGALETIIIAVGGGVLWGGGGVGMVMIPMRTLLLAASEYLYVHFLKKEFISFGRLSPQGLLKELLRVDTGAFLVV